MVEAKEYEFDDIIPIVEFNIEILDDKHGPVKQAEFMVSVDNGDRRAVKSDDSGIIKLIATAPVAEIKIASG